MPNECFKVQLHALPGCAYSRVRVLGSVATPPSAQSLRRWLTPMAMWSGRPVEFVWSADAGTVDWFEQWGDIVARLPNDLLSIRFMPARPFDQD
ncbi:MAG: hypothetical protein AAF219_11350 [Myxococcota bacterium]